MRRPAGSRCRLPAGLTEYRRLEEHREQRRALQRTFHVQVLVRRMRTVADRPEPVERRRELARGIAVGSPAGPNVAEIEPEFLPERSCLLPERLVLRRSLHR